MKDIFNQNFDKFEIYANRNIFVLNDASTGKPSVSPDFESSTADLNGTKEAYVAAKRKHAALATEVNALESSLNAMKTGLFNLRVAAQSLDAHGVTPLTVTARALAQRKSELEAMVSRANKLTARVVEEGPSSSANYGTKKRAANMSHPSGRPSSPKQSSGTSSAMKPASKRLRGEVEQLEKLKSHLK